MSSSPKIIVLKMREIIYTIVLVFLVVLLILCLVLMFSKRQTETGQTSQTNTSSETTQTPQTTTTAESAQTRQTAATEASETSASDISEQTYTPGVYTSPVTLGESTVDVEVTVDSKHINSIRLVNLSETATASYPLVSPSLEHIASQILEKQSLEEITCPQENRYTSQLLLSAISDALTLAKQSSLTTH